MSKLKEDKIREINELKGSVSLLAANIRTTKADCETYKNENEYIKEYIGTLAKGGATNSKA